MVRLAYYGAAHESEVQKVLCHNKCKVAQLWDCFHVCMPLNGHMVGFQAGVGQSELNKQTDTCPESWQSILPEPRPWEKNVSGVMK